jgi:hypothetical protein
MGREFAHFRTRLLGTWLLSNVTYVSCVLHFTVLKEYTLGFSVLIAWTLAFRTIGGSTRKEWR